MDTATFPAPSVSDRERVLLRLIAAPRDRVWFAWTRRLPDWWNPHGMSKPVSEMDLRPGGVFRTVMRAPDGAEYPTRGVLLEVVPPGRIVFTDACEAGWTPAEPPFVTVIVTFEDAGSGRTRCTTRALHWSATDRAKHEQLGFHQGWGESLDRLEALVPRRT